MKKITILILIYIISSCSSNQKRKDNLIINNTNNKKIESLTYVSPLSTLDTSLSIDSTITPFIGDLYYKTYWKDSNGANNFIISKAENYQEGFEKAEIFVYHYIQTNNRWILLWKTYDQVQGNGCDLSIKIPKDYIKITDLDSNFIAETSYSYTLDNRCDAVIVPAKMIIYIGKEKHSIKGFADLHLGPPEKIMNNYLKETGQKEVIYKELSKDFPTLPNKIKEYYSNLWDNFTKQLSD